VPDGRIALDDPCAPDVRALLERHLAFAHEHSPPDSVHALDLDGLADPAIAFFSYRADGRLLAVGALRMLDGGHAELKSMHTAEAARGRGIAREMVDFLVGEARARGAHRVSIETGATEPFAPARRLYASAGFVPCAPFGDYVDDGFSTCMTLSL